MTSIDELKQSWKDQNDRLEKNIKLNIEILKRMNMDKIKSNFSRYQRGPIFGLIIGLPVVFIMGGYLYFNFGSWDIFFAGLLIYLLTAMQTIFSIYQLATIYETKQEDPVLYNLHRLAKLERLRNCYIIITRFMYGALWLPIPVVLFHLISDVNLFTILKPAWVYINLGLIAIVALLGVWLSISYGLKRKLHPLLERLVNNIIRNDFTGQKLRDGMSLIREIEELEKENI